MGGRGLKYLCMYVKNRNRQTIWVKVPELGWDLGHGHGHGE